MDKGILCINYYFPPLLSTAVIRNYHIACTFAEFFDKVHVLTSDNYTRFPTEERKLPENVDLHSIYTLDYRRLLAGKKSDSHKPTTKKSSPFFQWEKKILQKADIITCISDGFKAQLKVNGRPTKTILRGVELRNPEAQYDKFTIAYTGSLYFDYRDPRALFAEIATLINEGRISQDDIQLLYAGRDGQRYSEWISEYDLDQIFINKNMVSQAEAKTIQNRSHINLLLTSSSPELTGVITGKIFEYFEALNPTLCLINGVKDPEFEALFSKLNAGTVVYNPPLEEGKMSSFILEKYSEWKSSAKVASTLNQQLIKREYGWKSQVEKMLNSKS